MQWRHLAPWGGTSVSFDEWRNFASKMKEELKRLGIQATAEVEPPWPGEWRKLFEIGSTTTLKLTKRDFGFLRSSTWVCLGKMQDLLRADFFPGHPGHQPVQQEDTSCTPGWQFYSRRVRWGIGPRLHNVHVNNNHVMPRTGCARQISQRTKEVL